MAGIGLGCEMRERPNGKHGRALHKALVEMGYELRRSRRHFVYQHPGNGATLTVGSKPTEGEKVYMVQAGRRGAPARGEA
jgi:hypothetical protein